MRDEVKSLKYQINLASGTQDRGFDPGRSRRIFRAKKNPQRSFLGGGGK